MNNVKNKTYMVLVVDRKKVMMFMVLEGMAVERYKEVIDNTVPQRVRANDRYFYGRNDKVFRHIEDHLHRHLQRVAEEAVTFASKEQIAGIILGGHKILFEKIKKHLPKNLSRKVKGTFVTELKTPFNNILHKAEQLINDLENGTGSSFLARMHP